MADPKNSAQALAQLKSAQKTYQNPNDILANQRQQLGVNDAQNTVTGLRGAINNTTKLLQQVAPSVMGRTGSSLVTSAQANRQIQNEQAPISQNLSNQTRDYGQANEDLTRLIGEAGQAASGIYQGQQDKMSYLQNLYNTLYGREQAAAEAKRLAREAAEDKRRFELQLAESRKARAASGGGGYGGVFDTGGGGGGGGAKAPKATMAQRSGGGFNFTDAGGKAISAAKYAQLTKQPIMTVLRAMGQKGDKYAAQVYNQLRLDPNPAARMNQYKKLYAPLFWGS